MADLNDVGEKVDGLESQINATNEALLKTPGLMGKIEEAQRKATEQSKKYKDQTENMVESFKSKLSSGKLIDFNAMIKPIDQDMFSKIGSGFTENMKQLAANGGDGWKTVAGVVASSQVEISASVTEMANKSQMGGKILSDVYANQLKSVAPVVAKVLAHAEANNKLEGGLISIFGAAGNLSEAFKIMGDNTGRNVDILHNLDSLTFDYNKRMAETATATGLLPEEVAKYTQSLMTIPGAYSSIASIGGSTMTQLEAAIKVSRGTTQNFGEVVKFLDDQYLQFNQTQGESLNTFSEMYQASNDLGFRFSVLKGIVGGVRDSFAMMGDQSASALNILESFAPALKESGLGPEGIAKMVQNLTGAVGSLDTAQKSFLSSQAGGTGGLQGAFQVDLKLKEGKLDEVVGMMQDVLSKQFGGKVVGLEQAAASGADAAQMQKQVALLKGGAFGSVVKSDAEAYKFIELMQKGVRPTDAAVFKEKTADSMDATMNQSNIIQERQESSMMIANNELVKQTGLLSTIAGGFMRSFTGNESSAMSGMETLKKESSKGLTATPNVVDKTALASEMFSGLGESVRKLGMLIDSVVENKSRSIDREQSGPKEINLTVQMYRKDGGLDSEETRKILIQASDAAEDRVNTKAVLGSANF